MTQFFASLKSDPKLEGIIFSDLKFVIWQPHGAALNLGLVILRATSLVVSMVNVIVAIRVFTSLWLLPQAILSAVSSRTDVFFATMA